MPLQLSHQQWPNLGPPVLLSGNVRFCICGSCSAFFPAQPGTQGMTTDNIARRSRSQNVLQKPTKTTKAAKLKCVQKNKTFQDNSTDKHGFLKRNPRQASAPTRYPESVRGASRDTERTPWTRRRRALGTARPTDCGIRMSKNKGLRPLAVHRYRLEGRSARYFFKPPKDANKREGRRPVNCRGGLNNWIEIRLQTTILASENPFQSGESMSLSEAVWKYSGGHTDERLWRGSSITLLAIFEGPFRVGPIFPITQKPLGSVNSDED